MDTTITIAVVHVLATTVSTAITTYLNAPPKPSFRETSGETLYDEDNWARVLDIQDILSLVRPFLNVVKVLDLGPLLAKVQPVPGRNGQRLGTHADAYVSESNSEAPPPYQELPQNSVDYFCTQSYRMAISAERLVEVLKIAASGPTRSSPRAWNLHITASEETDLEVLAIYQSTRRTMLDAHPKSFLAIARNAMNLHDSDILTTVERHF
ncbi:hypothetical protein P171DRAFT_185748 [Karstenula rhodostoma CBS 690.94]|uniref:Uncharacterized protein n=1 Tax=Karstenula rhodostoma CBS 690.94 TaxID=1392251 RepID=A0A9P4P5I0_9PLEO|nr:hypothetical protein P171DRAFT_185748 [Karstenula rhodostoma CBS 690.94]